MSRDHDYSKWCKEGDQGIRGSGHQEGLDAGRERAAAGAEQAARRAGARGQASLPDACPNRSLRASPMPVWSDGGDIDSSLAGILLGDRGARLRLRRSNSKGRPRRLPLVWTSSWTEAAGISPTAAHHPVYGSDLPGRSRDTSRVPVAVPFTWDLPVFSPALPPGWGTETQRACLRSDSCPSSRKKETGGQPPDTS